MATSEFPRIKQIIPAVGWQAVYSSPIGPRYKDLIGWAVAEGASGDTLRGLTTKDEGVGFADSDHDGAKTRFLGYAGPSQDRQDKWKEKSTTREQQLSAT